MRLIHEPVGSYRLPLRPSKDGADFSEQRQLVENRLNRFTISSSYGGQPLKPEGPAAEVYCDLNPPRLLDPVDFRPQGEYVQVVVAPSEEPLLSLQLRGPDGDWRQVAPRNDGRYVATVPLPREKTEFEIKMVDLAGNENTVKAVCPLFDPTGRDLADGRLAPASGRDGEAGLTGAAARRIARSPVLRDSATTTGEGYMMGHKVKIRETLWHKDKTGGHSLELDMGKGWMLFGKEECKR